MKYSKRKGLGLRKRKNSRKKRKETTRKETTRKETMRKELVRELKGLLRKHNATMKRKKKRRRKRKKKMQKKIGCGGVNTPPPFPPSLDYSTSELSERDSTGGYDDPSDFINVVPQANLDPPVRSASPFRVRSASPFRVRSASPIRVRSASPIRASGLGRLSQIEKENLEIMMRKYPYIGDDGWKRMGEDVGALKFLLIQESYNYKLYNMLIRNYPELLMSRDRPNYDNNNVDDVPLENKYVRLFNYILTIMRKRDGIDGELEYKGKGGDLSHVGADIDNRTHDALYGGDLWDPLPPLVPFTVFLRQSNDFMDRHLNIKEIIDHDNNRIISVIDGDMYSYPVADILDHYSDIAL